MSYPEYNQFIRNVTPEYYLAPGPDHVSDQLQLHGPSLLTADSELQGNSTATGRMANVIVVDPALLSNLYYFRTTYG